MLIERRCAGCGAGGRSPCPRCRAGAPAAGPVAAVEGCASVTAPFVYDGSVRELVLASKYRHDRSALRWLVGELASALPAPAAGTVVTWAPTTPSRRRVRGFDQAELVARRLGAELGLPARRLLRRSGGPSQTGRSGVDRRIGPTFVARRVPPTVLLVDDVMTTGATLRAASVALRAGGARSVDAAVLAATPVRPAGEIGTSDRSLGRSKGG